MALMPFGLRAEQVAPASPRGVPSDAELERDGAVIGNIRFDLQNIFATDTPEENKALFHLANRLHVRTRQSTIEQQLLFRPGDKFSRKKLDESERLLRSRRYLHFAAIRPVNYRDGRVDIVVETRDVWALSPTLNLGRRGGVNTSTVGVEAINVLGLGKLVSLNLKSDLDRTTRALTYQDPQLLGSRWTLATSYARSDDGRSLAFAVEQPFYALDTPWSGGVRWRDEERIDPVFSLGTRVEQFAVRQRAATLFAGTLLSQRAAWIARATAGVTYTHDTVLKLDTVPAQTDSNRLAYPHIGVQLLEDDFQKLENFNQIGRTEDINLGWQLSAQLGQASRAFGADRNATLFNGVLTHGSKLSEREILLVDLGVNALRDPTREHTALASTNSRYYLRQSPARLFYVNLRADVSTHTGLTLGGDNGLRGYPQRYQSGTGRWVFSAEQRLFTDWYPLRLFHVGAAAFVDAGGTWGKSQFTNTSRGVLADAGIGLRLGNSRAGFGNVIHIDLAFPFNPRDGISKVQFLVETKRSF